MGKLVRDGVGLAYEEAGSGAPPIVLVHDLGSDHTCFSPQVKHFSCRHRVVAVDLRGHGQSDGPRGACSVSVLADDVTWLCYELGLYRPVVLGLGLGGMVALNLATRYPDLPCAIVTFTSAAMGPGVESSSGLESIVPAPRVVFRHEEAPPLREINALVDDFLWKLAERAPP
jgi:3-oxoadipate enol-lactonase